MGYEGLLSIYSRDVVVQVGRLKKIPPLPKGRRSIFGQYQRTFQGVPGAAKPVLEKALARHIGMPGKRIE